MMTSTMILVFRTRFCLSLIVWFNAASNLYATLPPGNHELQEQGMTRADLELKHWLEQHAGQISIRDKNKNQILEMKKEGVLAQDYALLVQQNQKGLYDRSLVHRVEHHIKTLIEDDSSVLIPYILQELMKVPNLSLDKKKQYSEDLDLVGGRSCAKKNLVLSHLRRESLLPMTPSRIEKSVEWLSQLQSSDRMRYLRDVLNVVPKVSREKVRILLRDLVQKDPELLRRYSWLKPSDHRDQFFAYVNYAKVYAGRLKCQKSKDYLNQALKYAHQTEDDFQNVMTSLKKISRCEKRYGYHRSRQIWQDFKSQMVQIWGQKYHSESNLQIANSFWQQDRYEQSLKTLGVVLASEQKGDYHGRARLLKAKVLENKKDIKKSILAFEDFVKKHPNHEKLDEGLSRLLLLYMAQDQQKKAEEVAFRMVSFQGEKPQDARDVSSLGFALFWLGRIAMLQGDSGKAVMYWKRVSREYYSTYYGALGHYLVEVVEGKSYELFPNRTGQIRLSNLLGVLNEEERQTATRASTLLRLGLQKEARCEITEIGQDESRPHLSMLQSLVLHAGGDWLRSIVVYGRIPRSFRQGLPSLTERLLFPRRFHKVVEEYAQKLEMDPDFVLSLIRQESVFDPKARSGAGAVGLMQLMKATAKGEAKKLPQSYVSQGVKRSLQQPSSRKLMDATSNIILGVNHLNGLLKRFENPVYALSAYNAGSTAAKKWMKRFPHDDIFLFIEKIPYSETRSYVKLILRNYFYYKRWYGEPGEELPYLDMLAQSILDPAPA